MNFIKKLFGFYKPHVSKETRSKEVIINELLIKLAPLKRMAYVPITEHVQSSFSAQSKMGGYPYLRHEHDWPTCPNCTKQMPLFLQLNISETPTMSSSGVIQIFYCTNSEMECEITCEAWNTYAKSVVCRLIQPEGTSATIVPNLPDVLEEKQIISWKEITEYPNFYELEDHQMEIHYDDYAVLQEAGLGTSTSGDKLFGWPEWIQNPEYPRSNINQADMQFLFQIDSDDNLPFMFGDSGCAYIFQNPTLPEDIAMNWSCC